MRFSSTQSKPVDVANELQRCSFYHIYNSHEIDQLDCIPADPLLAMWPWFKFVMYVSMFILKHTKK